MLTHLHIKNFTLVDELDIELHEGLTVITGETGAGKSIMLDALGLTLGDRSDSLKVKSGRKQADICASFDIKKLAFAQKWLAENDLNNSDISSNEECLLRRVITKEGRSRAYINGETVTLQQLKALGERLIDIHSQHEHQSLLATQTHRRLLDEYAGAEALAKEVRRAFAHWDSLAKELKRVSELGEEMNARFQLLSYQVDELDQLNVREGELAELEREQRILANTGKTQQSCQQISDICSGEGVGLKDRLSQAIRLLTELPEKPEPLQELENLLQSAFISIDEAQSDLDRFIDGSEDNPHRLQEVEDRLNTIYEVSRKHRIKPEELEALHSSLKSELEGLQSGDDLAESLSTELSKAGKLYQQSASKLSDIRNKSSNKLCLAVNKKLADLAMKNARLTIELATITGDPSPFGNEKIEFLISTNPGQPPQALHKVASGGELSRISLAIQVITAQTSTTPTLVFDEVDVGIGGTTGDVVGHMLCELGAKGQIFCVTHLAQVASKAHHHLRVEKHVTKKDASTSLSAIEGDEKVLEIARMMGGKVDSKQSLDHARQMLENAN